jgi:8-oxo-dGTP pyrophosphatase MutT (NUDIX family)
MWQQNRQQSGFTAADLRKKASAKLTPELSCADKMLPVTPEQAATPAAVLVPVIDRHEASVLLTRRTAHLPHHAGQIAFPGGKIAPTDSSINAAALRETEEETGISPAHIELVGELASHETGTGFLIHPVVGILTPPFEICPCANEVDEVFEVPLSFLMDPAHYRREAVRWRGQDKMFYVIDYDHYRIWGATAYILKALQERLYAK